MIIERVKKGQKIEADKINSIIEACNKRYDASSLMEGSSSFSMPQGGSNSYREWPPMWSCKANDGQGKFKIRGGIVIIQDTKEKSRKEIVIQDTEISSNGGDVYVSVDIKNNTAVITVDAPDGAENIKIGVIDDNGKGFKVYKQLSRSELYVLKLISFIAGDGIEISESDDDKEKRIITITSNTTDKISFIAKDGIDIKDYYVTEIDGSNKRRVIEIGCSGITPDIPDITGISIVKGDNVEITGKGTKTNPYVVHAEKVSLITTDPGIYIQDCGLTTDHKHVIGLSIIKEDFVSVIVHDIISYIPADSFIEGDRIHLCKITTDELPEVFQISADGTEIESGNNVTHVSVIQSPDNQNNWTKKYQINAEGIELTEGNDNVHLTVTQNPDNSNGWIKTVQISTDNNKTTVSAGTNISVTPTTNGDTTNYQINCTLNQKDYNVTEGEGIDVTTTVNGNTTTFEISSDVEVKAKTPSIYVAKTVANNKVTYEIDHYEQWEDGFNAIIVQQDENDTDPNNPFGIRQKFHVNSNLTTINSIPDSSQFDNKGCYTGNSLGSDYGNGGEFSDEDLDSKDYTNVRRGIRTIFGGQSKISNQPDNNGLSNNNPLNRAPSENLILIEMAVDPEWFTFNEDNLLAFNTTKLDEAIAEAVNEIEVTVEAEGVYREVGGHGELHYSIPTTTTSVDGGEIDSTMSY